MGCPDWPKCFGRMIPPTQASELPFNYQEIYKEKLHGQVEFNPTKTWIEYLNRLLGALTGVFVVITTYLAFKQNRKIFYTTLAALIMPATSTARLARRTGPLDSGLHIRTDCRTRIATPTPTSQR